MTKTLEYSWLGELDEQTPPIKPMNNLQLTHSLRDRILLKLTNAFVLFNNYSDNYATQNYTVKPAKDVECEIDIKWCIKMLGELSMVPPPSKAPAISEEIINRIMNWKGLEIRFYEETGETVTIRSQQKHDDVLQELNKRKFSEES